MRIVMTGITESQQGHESLRASEGILRLLLEHAPDALAMFDQKMCYLAVSRRWREDYFLGDRNVIGVSHYELFPEIQESWKSVHRRGLSGEVIRAAEDRFERKDGTIQWLRWEVLPWHLSDGAIGGIFIFSEDITRNKQAEEEIRHLNLALEQRVEERTARLTAEIIARKHSEQILNQYAAIIDSSEDAIISKTLEGIITSWNRGAERIFGYSREEALGRPVSFLIPEQYQPEEVTLLGRLRKGDCVHHYETVRRCKEGKLIDISVSLSPIRDHDGNIVGVSKIARNITERRLAEEALKKSNSLLNATQHLCKVGGWEFDIGSGRATWTEELYRLHEMPADSDFDHVSESLKCYRLEDRTIISSAFNSAAEEGRAYDLEFPFTTFKGRALWIRTTCQPVYENGEVVRLIGNVMDITDRKQAELELRIAAAAFETLDAIMITDANANIIKVNRSFTHVTGYTQEEVIGKNPRIMSSGRHDKLFFEELFQTVLLTGSWEGEIWDKRKNGEIYPRSMTITAIKDEHHKITSFAGIFRDITERKQAEESVRKAEQRFRFMLENSPVAVRISSKATGKVVYANRNYGILIGLPLEQATGIDPHQFYANRQDYLDILNQLGKGESIINKLVKLDNKIEIKWALASFMLTEFENEPAYLGWLYDISERKRLEEQAQHLSSYDTLTELPNRRMLNDRLQQAMAATKRSGNYGAVMFMDLDKFKSLNDTQGHVVGDLLLIEVGRRISNCVREMDTVARFGGDEFVVMLSELDVDENQSKSEAGSVAEKIRSCLNETYFLKMQQDGVEICVKHHCSSSIGVTLFNGHEANQDVIFKQADAAMYQAKEGGRNLVCFYDAKTAPHPCIE